MKREDRHEIQLDAVDAGDARFARRLAELYAPEPSSAEQRLAFTRGLEARLERRRQRRWLPALAGAGAVAAVTALVLLRAPDPGLTPNGVGAPLATGLAAPWSAQDTEEWEMQLFYPDVLLDAGSGTVAAAGSLPADYVAIGSAFLDE